MIFFQICIGQRWHLWSRRKN